MVEYHHIILVLIAFSRIHHSIHVVANRPHGMDVSSYFHQCFEITGRPLEKSGRQYDDIEKLDVNWKGHPKQL